MAHVTLTPYVVTEPNGSDPRIAIPVSTPAAFVLVETRKPGSFVVKSGNGNGVPIALEAAKAYARSHRALLARLYDRLATPGESD